METNWQHRPRWCSAIWNINVFCSSFIISQDGGAWVPASSSVSSLRVSFFYTFFVFIYVFFLFFTAVPAFWTCAFFLFMLATLSTCGRTSLCSRYPRHRISCRAHSHLTGLRVNQAPTSSPGCPSYSLMTCSVRVDFPGFLENSDMGKKSPGKSGEAALLALGK